MNILIKEKDISDNSADGLNQFAAAQPKPLFGLGSIRRHKKALWLSIAVATLAGLIFALVRPVTYTASVQLLVYDRQILTGAEPVITPGDVDIPLVENQIEILKSRLVLANVIQTLKLDEDPEFFSSEPGVLQRLKRLISLGPSSAVSASDTAFGLTLESLRRKLNIRRIGMSHVVLVRVKVSRPDKAARIANELAHAYLQERTGVVSDANTIRELYQGLGPTGYVVSEAAPPIRPDWPPAVVIVLGAALVGLGAGSIIAVLLDVLDNTFRTPGQLEWYLGVKCLCVIPFLGTEKSVPSGKWRRSDRQTDQNDEVAIALPVQHCTLSRQLRRVIATMQDMRPCGIRSLGVASSVTGEGATTIALNLARALMDSGKRVLLIDCVHEHPSLSRLMAQEVTHSADSGKRFGLPGLQVIIDERTGLNVVPIVPAPDLSDCSAQLSHEIVDKALELFDFVIFDMPSLVSGADVRAAAPILDGFLLVVRWGGTDSDLIRQALQSVGRARSKVVGVVLNMADGDTIEEYGDRPEAEGLI